MAWTPRGYTHVIEWVVAEIARRGQDRTTANWSRAFDDLADYLADEDDPEESRNALFVFESGRKPYPVPLHEWRKVPDKRAGMSRRRVYRNYNAMGFGSSEPGCVVIRTTLRLTDTIDIENDEKAAIHPSTQLALPQTDTKPISTATLAAFLHELDQEYQGKPKPSLDDIDELGRAKFAAKWRKAFRDHKNDEPGGLPLYPNLYSRTPGKRRKD